MRIAIVDSGIDTSHERLLNTTCHCVSLDQSHGKLQLATDSCLDRIGHGTACAAIVSKHFPGVEIIGIRIFRDQLLATESDLTAAISWATYNDVQIINLALGICTETPSIELERACEGAAKRGIVIVAAAHNNINTKSYPAYFPTVFGVAAGYVRRRSDHGYLMNCPIEFVAKGTLQRLAWREHGYTISSGSSFACAHFTGIVAKALHDAKYAQQGIGLRKYLIGAAKQNVRPIQDPQEYVQIPRLSKQNVTEITQDLFDPKQKYAGIHSLGLFPVSKKEISSFVSMRDYASFRIHKYVDFPFVTSEHPAALSDKESYRKPSNDEMDEIDTFVIANYLDNVFEGNIQFGDALLLDAIKRNKNLYVLDRATKKHINALSPPDTDYTGKIYLPEITSELAERTSCFSLLPKIQTPVIAVVGTSNIQGKFTCQVIVKQILECAGYKVAFVSSEPQGDLFGAVFSFPYGHNSTVDVRLEQWTVVLDNIFRGVQECLKPDIFICGTQGMTVPRQFLMGTSNKNVLMTLSYLTGLNPDCIICAINPEDSIELIRNVHDTTRILCGAKTILCALNPWQRERRRSRDGFLTTQRKRLQGIELENLRTSFQDRLGLPVIDIVDPNAHEAVLVTIEQFFQ